MTDIPPTRRTDEPPLQDGAPLAGWPVMITAEEAAALQTALKQLQTALDAVVRERDEALAEVERLTRERDNARSELDLARVAGRRLLGNLDQMTRDLDAARYFLRIFIHAYENGKTVGPILEGQARDALEDGR